MEDLYRVRGCLLLLLPVKELVMVAATSFVEGEGIASGVAVVWRVDLGLFYGALRRRAMALGQVGVECVPGRWTITGDFFLFLATGFCCGSFQSQGEMALFLVYVWCRSSPCFVVGSGDVRRLRQAQRPPWTLLSFSFSLEACVQFGWDSCPFCILLVPAHICMY